jgi:hypothetical protein
MFYPPSGVRHGVYKSVRLISAVASYQVIRLTEIVLLGVVSILGNPDWENACMGHVLEMHKSDPARFEDRVKLLTKKFALRDKLDESQSMKTVYEELWQEV